MAVCYWLNRSQINALFRNLESQFRLGEGLFAYSYFEYLLKRDSNTDTIEMIMSIGEVAK